MCQEIVTSIHSGVVVTLQQRIEIFQSEKPKSFWFGIFGHGFVVFACLVMLYRIFIGIPFEKYLGHKEDSGDTE